MFRKNVFFPVSAVKSVNFYKTLYLYASLEALSAPK